MRPGASQQYMTGVVILEPRDFPVDEEKVIKTAWDYEAAKTDSEEIQFVVRFPNREDDILTEDELRRSIRAANSARV